MSDQLRRDLKREKAMNREQQRSPQASSKDLAARVRTFR